MKISMLHYTAPPIVGGVENVIEHHARLMADDGHEVQVIAGRGGEFDPRIPFVHLPLADSRHAEVLALKAELDQGVVPRGFNTLTEKLEAQLRVLTSETDVLIAHNVGSLNKNLALTNAVFNLCTQKHIPRTILWHHDIAWTMPRYQSELRSGIPWDLLRTPWDGAIQVTISDTRRDQLANLMGIDETRIKIIPNGVDAEILLKLESQTRQFVRQLDLFSASPLLLLPARITPRKNIELALEMLAVLRKTFPEARIVITGPLGPHNAANLEYFNALKQRCAELGIEDCVHFLAEISKGYLPHAVIADFYKLADALFFPSFDEGFGIPILEAGLAGLPIFCSDIPSLRSLGGNCANYFSPHEGPQAIANLLSSHFRASPVFALRAEVRNKYDWGHIYTSKIAKVLSE